MPTQTVDWTTRSRELRGHTMFTVYRVTCSSCGYTRTMKCADVKKALRTGGCRRCSCGEKGRKGFAATCARYGHRWAIPHVQRYREAHPTQPEYVLADLLTRLDLDWRREVPLSTKARGRRKWTCLLDFVVDYGGVEWVIEVDGRYWHEQPAAVRRDRRKNRLLKRRGIPFLRVSDADLDGSADGERRVERLIRDFLGLRDTDAAPPQIFDLVELWMESDVDYCYA